MGFEKSEDFIIINDYSRTEQTDQDEEQITENLVSHFIPIYNNDSITGNTENTQLIQSSSPIPLTTILLNKNTIDSRKAQAIKIIDNEIKRTEELIIKPIDHDRISGSSIKQELNDLEIILTPSSPVSKNPRMYRNLDSHSSYSSSSHWKRGTIQESNQTINDQTDNQSKNQSDNQSNQSNNDSKSRLSRFLSPAAITLGIGGISLFLMQKFH